MADSHNDRGGRGERALTLDPRIRRVGAACFEGALLADWAIKNVRRDTPQVRVQKRLIPMLIRMLDRCEPTVLVLPDVGPKGVRRSANVREMIDAVAREANVRGIEVRSIHEKEVKAAFGKVRQGAGRNKQTINEIIVSWFPELKSSRPKARRVWDSEAHATPLFDAIARWCTWRGLPTSFQGRSRAAPGQSSEQE